MAEERMADLGVIAMHYNERISVDDLCHAFIQAHPRRLFQASLFEDYYPFAIIVSFLHFHQ